MVAFYLMTIIVMVALPQQIWGQLTAINWEGID